MKPQREKRYSIGNTLDFLEIQRKDPGNRPKDERLRDYRNVELQLSHTEIQRQSARCMDCGTPFCHAYGCPISNVIPEMNDWVYRGKWREALSILLSTNNFPEFTGRVCPAPCEAACVAGINGEPVTIRQLELAIIEKGFETGNIHAAHPEVRFDKRAAVIGAGPAGLSVADTLNKAGYPVIVYDSARYPGGILRYGIPDFKLEKWIVERRVRLMEGEGVIFETGVTVGEDLSYGYLRDRFDAICIACGAREPRDLLVPGRDLKEIHFAMDYLTQQNKRLGDETIDPSREITAQGKTVVVIGGGDTGSDCLGTALRQGAKKVYQLEILPKPPVERSKTTPWPMWPIMLHETHAHQEGGELYWSVMTKEFLGENGVLKKLRCVEVDWCLGEGGRLVPKEMEGTDFEVEADMVILAMGFVGPGENRIIEEMGVELDDRGTIQADDHNMTTVAGLFVAGDSNLGQSLVVRAIADGRKAAQGIRAYLQTY